MRNEEKKYSGVIVPMITPLSETLRIDHSAVEIIIQQFEETNVSPFLLGTTGESVSLSLDQKTVLVRTVTNCTSNQTKVYAGISGNCLQESVNEAKTYFDFGVDAVVAHLPFYYPVSSFQMLAYYKQLADTIDGPLFLYNNPITTNISIPLDVIESLSYHSNIVGLKDSERGLERLEEAIHLWSEREDFAHLLGWAAQSAYALQKGSDGIVPSTGNLSPRLYYNLYTAAREGNLKDANELQQKTNILSEVYQKNRDLSQSLPALKVMMEEKGLCRSYVMPPMYRLEEKEQNEIIEEMNALSFTIE